MRATPSLVAVCTALLVAVSAGDAAQLVAAQILVDFPKECIVAVLWNRQAVPQLMSSGNFGAGGFLPHRG